MIRTLLALLLGGLVATCTQETPFREHPKPALWAIESASGDTLGWLFGTIHVLPDNRPWRSAAVVEAITHADLLVVEAADLDPSALKAAEGKLANPVEGPPLAARLPAALRPDLAALEARKGVRFGSLDSTETWAAALALAASARKSQGTHVDRELLADFRARPVLALEGAQRQLMIFDALPEREQRDLLAAVVAEAAADGAQEKRLVEAWRAGDLAALSPVLRTGILADRELSQALLVDRNRAWTSAVAKILRNGRRPLVAVGAAHMLGPEGMPALLARRGLKVRRVS